MTRITTVTGTNSQQSQTEIIPILSQAPSRIDIIYITLFQMPSHYPLANLPDPYESEYSIQIDPNQTVTISYALHPQAFLPNVIVGIMASDNNSNLVAQWGGPASSLVGRTVPLILQ